MKKYSAQEKNKVVEMILSKQKTVKEMAEATKDAPAESTIRKWVKEYKSRGMFVDGNNNDAIASWSGYSYQGKISILCTIEILNRIYDTPGWEKWKLQLEKLQDFVLINDMIIESMWQVKARLSSKRFQDYEDAMKKLLEDRKNVGVLSADCYLVTAKEVENWTDKENKYQKDVFLYKYQGRSVTITAVSEAIQEQIEILLEKIGMTADKESVYLQLCNLIDDKVAEFHKAGKTSKYTITFSDIVQRVRDTEKFEERVSVLRQRENIYKNLCEKIIQGSQNYCNDICEGKKKGTCKENDCAVKRNKELVDGVNIGYYMRSIRPELHEDLDLIFSNPDEYADTICYSMHTAPADALELENDMIVVNCYEGKMHAIPTMLDLSEKIEKRRSRKLESIEKNEWLKQNIGKKVLIGETQKNVYGTKLSKFTDIRLEDLLQNLTVTNKRDDDIDACLRDAFDLERATEINNSVIILDREWIIEYFGDDDKDE